MNAGESFRAGRLREAIEAQGQEVKAHPGDPARRLFLFELLAFAGDLDRARKQADAIRHDDVALDAAVATYGALIEAERARRTLFLEGRPPAFLAEPPAHVRLRLAAVAALRAGRPAEAAAALAEANGAAPAVRGRLNGRPVDSLRDADDLFGTVLEVQAHGEYYWVPLEQVGSLAMNPPQYPRDLLWVRARLEAAGTAGEVFLPALYPGSHAGPDDALRLGRLTDWKGPEGGGGPALGVGARVFWADDDEVGLLEWREFQAGEDGPP